MANKVRGSGKSRSTVAKSTARKTSSEESSRKSSNVVDQAEEPGSAPEKGTPASNLGVPLALGLGLLIAGGFWLRRDPVPTEPSRNPSENGEPSAVDPASNRADPTPRRPEPSRPPPLERPAGQPTLQDVRVRPRFRSPTSPDPKNGTFTLAQATEGMTGSGALIASITTNQGVFTCDLWPDRAPNTVANFVGLARGKRDYWDPVEGRWQTGNYFNNSVFHRVIPDFMIQGGDILRSGQGGPGYEFADENVTNHNEAGLLCMANHGPNTNGSQFFILEAPRDHLNGSYSVFGKCGPIELVQRIARVPRNEDDMPYTPVRIQSVEISRRSAP